MTTITRGRLLSLLSLVAVALLVYVPARVAWDRASAPPAEDHGLAELAAQPAPSGVTWECVIGAVETADLPGTADGFAIELDDDEDLDADLVIERALGGDLRATIALDSLVVNGLPTTRRIPLACEVTE